MPGTFTIDAGATFTSMLLLSSSPKRKFGTQDQQETNAAGVPKWAIELAVTFAPAFDGQSPVSEVLSVTVASGTDPGMGIAPGTPIVFEQLRLGLNPPEKNDRGGIRGGKLWYTAAGIRSAVPVRTPRGEAAA